MIPLASFALALLSVAPIVSEGGFESDLAVTGNATTTAITSQPKIAAPEWMAVNAMRLAVVLRRWTDPTSNVGGAVNHLKMPRIEAGAISTQVIHLQPDRNGPIQSLIGRAMCQRRPGGCVEIAITRTSSGVRPYHTIVGQLTIDLLAQPEVASLNIDSRHDTKCRNAAPMSRFLAQGVL